MGLKYKIAKLEDVAENVRTLYKANGSDGFVLDAEGVVESGRLDEFRNNNIQLTQQLEKLKGIDPAKYHELIGLDQKVKEKKLIDAGDVEGLVNLRTTAMREELEGKLSTTSETLTKANSQLAVLMIDNAIRDHAMKAGIVTTAMDDVLLRARATYVMENGQAVPKGADGKIVYGKDGVTPMPMNEWITSLKKTAPHLFVGSSGSGAGGGRGNGVVDLSKASPLEKINAGLAQGGLLKDLPAAG